MKKGSGRSARLSENKSKNIQDDLEEKNDVSVELESTKAKTTKNDAKESFFELRVTILGIGLLLLLVYQYPLYSYVKILASFSV